MIKIVVADQDFIARKGWECLLSSNSDLQVQGFAASSEELLEKLFLFSADVLIIDHTSPVFGTKVLSQVKAQYPDCRILAVTGKIARFDIMQALSSGVKSYLLKECDEQEINEAIYATFSGESFLCGKIASILDEELDRPVNPCQGMNISDRELEVIRLVAEGHSNKQIAEMLCLSTHTITTHRKNIMSKLDINNTAGLVLFAVKNGLVGPNKFLFS